MDRQLATIMGLLLSDGSVYFDRSKRTFCISFTSKVKELREVFKQLMIDVFGVQRFYEDPCDGAISVRKFSKSIAEFLFTLSPTFRKLPCKSVPKCALHETHGTSVIDESGVEWPPCIIPKGIYERKEFAIPFLRAFASGDGSVYFSPRYRMCYIELTCWHPTLKEGLVKCLETIGIRCFTKWKGVFISSLPEVKKFYETVGFLPESVVCDRKSKWLGLPKSKVLEIALSSLS